MNESFGTLSETINGLIKLGYTHDFNVPEECLVCHQINGTLSPNDFQIDKVYRFEGVSDPEYQSILYAISSAKYNIKGTLVNGYGISADEETSNLIALLQTNKMHINMENKSNESTPLRPEGNRVISAPLVEMNLFKVIDQIRNETTWENSDRNAVTLFKSETLRIVLIGLHDSATLDPHKTNGVISIQVLKGKIIFTAEEQTILLEAGQMIALQANSTHSVMALSESFFLLSLAMNDK